MLYTEDEITDYVKATRKIAGKMPPEKAKVFFRQSYMVFEELDKESQQLFVKVFEQLGREMLLTVDEALEQAKDFRQNHPAS